MTPAEQAVVDVALERGWLQPAALQAIRASAPPGQLLPALRAHLSPAALHELRQVYEAAQRRGGTEAARGAAQEAATLAVADSHSTVVYPSAGLPGVAREDPQPGEALGGYWIERELARGGMGVVYVARDSAGRKVALKLLQSELAGPELMARFAAEAEVTARLNHPNVVGVHASGEHLGQAWYAMELVEGESLGDRLEREGPLEPKEAAALTQVLAEALAHVHSRGVLHRDLKPDNVLLAAPDGRPILTDFGVARRSYAEERLTTTGEMVGTPSYMPPEQAAGELDRIGPASDVYALGATLYAAVTGEPPFGAQQQGLAVIKKVLQDDPPPPSSRREGIPRDLDAIVLTCLAKEPEQRYADAAAMADDLGRFVAGRGVIARVPGWRERLGRWVRRHRASAAVLGVGAALGLLLGLAGAVNELRKRYELRQAELALEAEAQAEETWSGASSLIDESRRAFQAIERELKDARAQLDKYRPPPDWHDEDKAVERRRKQLERDYSERAARQLKLYPEWEESLLTEIARLEAPAIPAGLEERRAKVLALGRTQGRVLARTWVETQGSLLLFEKEQDLELAQLEAALERVDRWAEVEPDAWELGRWGGELGLLRVVLLANRVDPDQADTRADRAQAVVSAARAVREPLRAWAKHEERDPRPLQLLSEACRAEVISTLLGQGRYVLDLADAQLDDGGRAVLEERAQALVGAFERARALAKGSAGMVKSHWWHEALTLEKHAERACHDARQFERAIELCEDHSRSAGKLVLTRDRPPGLDVAFEIAGRSLLRLGRPVEARQFFKRWADMKEAAEDPEALPWVWLARCARLRGDADRAKELLEQAKQQLESPEHEQGSDFSEGCERLVVEWVTLLGDEGQHARSQVRKAWSVLPAIPQRKALFERGIQRVLATGKLSETAQKTLLHERAFYLAQDE